MKLKRIFCLTLTLCMVIGCLPGFSITALATDGQNWTSNYAGAYQSENTSAKTITIANAAQLARLAYMVNNGTNYSGYTVTLTSDISLSAHNWVPIGLGTTVGNTFVGTFDGGGHTISGLYVNTSSVGRVGLFGHTGIGAEIKNVNLSGSVTASYSGALYTGALAGSTNQTTISNCTSSVTVTATQSGTNGYCYTGGLIGQFGSSSSISLTGCSATGGVTSTCNATKSGYFIPMHYCGGLVGYVNSNSSYITSCSYSGSVMAVSSDSSGYVILGGFTGNASGATLTNCSASGSVTCPSAVSVKNAGGFIGYAPNTVPIYNSYSTASVAISGTMGATITGGFIGKANNTITNCYSTGKVTSTATNNYAGGFMGNGFATLTNCYWQSDAYGAAYSTNKGTINSLTALTSSQLKNSGNIGSGSYSSYTIVEALNAAAVSIDSFCCWKTDGTNNGYPSLYPGVIYYGNGNVGGTVPVDATIYTAGNTMAVLGNTGSLTKAGAFYSGWNTASDGSGTSYAAGDTFDIGFVSVRLYAKWEAGYLVTYNNNYTGGKTSTVTAGSGTMLTAPKPAPTRNGYTFQGWYKEKECITVWKFASDKVTSAMTLYAKWTADTQTITYNNNGGSGEMENLQAVTDAKTTLTKNSFTKAGYSFVGWATTAAGNALYTDKQAIIIPVGGLNLYAVWKIDVYQVTFSSNSSTYTTENVEYNKYATEPSPAPQRNGYTFGGWYKDNAFTAKWNFTNIKVTEATTLYAKWTADTQTITYSNNGGSGEMENLQAVTDAKITLTKNSFTKAGYSFGGWATSAEGSVAYTNQQEITIPASGLNLYAVWTINKYTVMFKSNGSTYTTKDVEYNKYAAEPSPTPQWDGYTFGGWYKDDTFTIKWNFANDKVTEATTLFAKWTANSQTITYSNNGGSGAMSDQTAVTDAKITLTKNIFIKAGYSFSGWATNTKGSVVYTDKQEIAVPTSGLSLYAVWTADTQAVTYNNNGGNGTMGDQPAVTDATIVLKGNSFKRSGYTFIGWATSTDGSVVYWDRAVLTMPTGGLSLYAVWLSGTYYKVTYDNNGSGGGSAPTDVNFYSEGQTVTVPGNTGNLTKAGNTFAGWSLAADGRGPRYKAGSKFNMGSGDITLYALWTDAGTYTVTYHGNGNTEGTEPVDSNLYYANESITASGQNNLAKTGYVFACWNTAADSSGVNYNSAATYTISKGNINLYAVWVLPTEFGITYNGNGSNGGTAPVDSVLYHPGDPVIVLDNTNLAKDGYVFSGWNTASDGSGLSYTAGQSFHLASSNITLYAQWVINTSFTLTYNANHSDSGTPPSGSAYNTGDEITVAAGTSLVKTGYGFIGWNTKADGGGINYAAGSNLKMGSGNIILYACWVEEGYMDSNTYSVAYDGNGNDSGSAPTDSTGYKRGATVTVSDSGTLTKTGNLFIGWNTNADGSGSGCAASSTFTMGGADITLYAQWQKDPLITYSVTYDGNGNTGGTAPTDGNYSKGAAVTVSDYIGLIKSDYIFAGWNTKADGKGINLIAGDIFKMGKAKVTLYAQWNQALGTPATFTVSYNNNGSDSGIAPTDVNVYVKNDSVTVPGQGNLAKSGYQFLGWNTASDGSGLRYSIGEVFHIGEKNITLYAEWVNTLTNTIHYYEIDQTSGTAPTDSQKYQFGMTATILGNSGNLARTGYQFAGWNTAADGTGTTYSVGSAMGIGNSDISLYVKWTAVCYTLSYDGNGNTGGSVPSSTTFYKGATTTAAGSGNLVRNGYSFSSWNTAANGTGTCYNSGDSFTITSNIILYANWTPVASPVVDSPSRTITVTETSSDLFTGSSGAILAEANVNSAFSSSVEVKVTDTDNGGASFGFGVNTDVYPFDISLYVKGTNTKTNPAPGYAVTISLPVPEDLLDVREQLLIAHKSDDGTVTKLTSSLKQIDSIWYLVFKATEFSPYALVVSNQLSHDTASGLPYYLKDSGNKVFIGFAAGGKYIAPDGVTVLFTPNPKGFTDISTHWGKKYIDFVAEREIFMGIAAGVFSPNMGMTRAMLATVIGRLYERSYGEIKISDARAFTDCNYNNYYGKYVDWAAENGIIQGVGGGIFQPDRQISRQEMVAMLYRFAVFLKLSINAFTNKTLNYPDTASIATWARDASLYCQEAGIITGRSNGNFAPTETASRAEVAAIIQRFVELVLK